MEKRILITGATGKVGTQLTELLQQRGLPLRVAVHSPDKGARLSGPNTEPVPFDFDAPATITAALDGIDTLVLLTSPDARQVDWAIRTIDLAKAAGVRRVVRMSVLAAAMEPGIRLGRWHRTVERYLQASGLDWTIVRPGPFMQNFLGMYPGSGSGFALPGEPAPVTHIHVRDVARGLAAVVEGEGHSGKVYMLTGGQPLQLSQAAQRLGLPFRSTSFEDAGRAFTEGGAPAWFAEVLLELFGAFGTGAVGLTTSTFTDLTGRAPISFDAFAAEVRQAGKSAA